VAPLRNRGGYGLGASGSARRSGAWPDDEEGNRLAARLSAAVGVYVATDNDEAGDRYASRIGATLARASITAKRIKGGE
jgi:hypothetical protein